MHKACRIIGTPENHHRRVLSKDVIELPLLEFKKVPGSTGDSTGYVPEP